MMVKKVWQVLGLPRNETSLRRLGKEDASQQRRKRPILITLASILCHDAVLENAKKLKSSGDTYISSSKKTFIRLPRRVENAARKKIKIKIIIIRKKRKRKKRKMFGAISGLTRENGNYIRMA